MIGTFWKSFIDSKWDVLVATIATISVILLSFTAVITFTVFLLFIVYSAIRFRDVDISFAISSFVFLFLFIGAIVIEESSTRVLVSQDVEVYQDYKFVQQDTKLIVNYSDASKLKIANLDELNWYRLQADGCNPVKMIQHYTYWTTGAETKTSFICEKDIPQFNNTKRK